MCVAETTLLRGSTSKVWIYFEQTENSGKVKCKICLTVLSKGAGKSGSTLSMRNHLNAKHRKEYNHMLSLEQKPSSSQPKRKSPKYFQPSLAETISMSKIWDINDHRALKLHDKIGKMIALDNQPFNVVENEGFIAVLKEAQPHYKVKQRC